MINAIILSKDRACQLELLIRSISRKCKNLFNIKVIYEHSNYSFELGYNKLKEDLYYENRFGLDKGYVTLATLYKNITYNLNYVHKYVSRYKKK